MDLNDRFKQPDTSGGLNNLFSTEYAFEPIRPVQKAPIQTGTFNGLNDLRNAIGETVRDNVWEWAGKKIQPQTVIRDGKLQSTENKTFNNLTTEELNNKLTDLTASKPEEADGVIYKLRNPRTNEVKYGKAGDNVWKRYSRDQAFQENWVVEYERPMKDTAYAERLIHGNKKALEQQSYDYGNAQDAPLAAGGTEIYKKDPLSREAMKNVKELLTPEQQSYAEKVWDGLKIRTGFGDIDTKGNKLENLSTRERIAEVSKARQEFMKDALLGAGIGIEKYIGGWDELTGNKSGKEIAQRTATQLQNAVSNRNGLGQEFGEMAPDFVIPAVGKISKSENLAKRIMQGAGSGAVLTGGAEAVKSKSGIKEGLETNVGMATGIGAVVGGAIGAITKNQALGKEIGSAFEQGDKQMQDAILNEYPKARGALEKYVKERQTENATSETDIAKKEKLQQEQVKPTRERLRTKRGREINSQDVEAGKKEVEDIEYNVVNPKAKDGEALQNQTYVPEVNNPKKFKYGYDERGRIYTEDSNLMSQQGGATQKASLQQAEKRTIESAKEEVSRRLEFYDNDKALRDRYGQNQASYKASGEQETSKDIANRLQFEKDQYKEILKDKTLDRETLREAREQLSKLNKQTVTDYKTTKEELDRAEEKFKEQFKVADAKKDIREKEISTEYKLFKEAEMKSAKEGYEKPVLKSESEVKRQIVQNATTMISDAKKAIAELIKKEKHEGRTFKPESITKEQKEKYKDEVALIEDVQTARSDLAMYKQGKIDLDELTYREKRRIDGQLDRANKRYTNAEEAEKAKADILKKYEDIGVYVKDSEIKTDKQIERSGKKEKPEEKVKREDKEVKDAERKHTELIQTLREYDHTKQSPRYKKGDKAGQKILSDSQMKDVDEGILSLKEIADKKNPIAKKEDFKDARTKAKEDARKKVTEHKQNKLGIVWQTSPKDIKFKDTIQDASNSVAQVTAVLLGSKNLAKLAKSAGSETIGDIREIIGKEMQTLLPEDFPVNASKDTVKPIFMTENYGQGQRGLVRDIMKQNGVSKQDAQTFLEAYNKSFEKLAPELKQLRESIMDIFKRGDGVIKYTMPDGFPVEFTLKKTIDGKYSIKGKEVKIKIQTDSVDDMSAAILPNIIHSVDAYVARQMMKRGVPTVHDAFYTPRGKTDEWVRDQYADVMSKLKESNLLEDIAKSIGDEGLIKKIGDLDSSAIRESAKEGDSIKPEHSAGEIEKAKEREIDLSTEKTDEDVMKEFMAKDNVREEKYNQLVKAMTNEAGYRTMSVAKDTDDVFERQVALAHQSAEYNQKMAIKAPDGVDKKMWDKVQREIFNEARAKLEYNPLLNNVIQGERKFFTESGKVIGQETKTLKEILVEEKRIGRKLWKSMNREDLKAVRQIAPNYEKLQIVVKNWTPEKKLTNAEATAKEIVTEARTPKFERSTFKKNIDKVLAYFKSQVSEDKVSMDFQKLLAHRSFNETNAAKKAENLKKDLDKRIPEKEREAWTKSILRTDYNAIQDLKSQKEAEDFMKEHDNLYQIVKDYVNQNAKAIGESSEQVGFFRNNARAIQEELNLPRETAPIIDRMISIKAMTESDWKKIDKIRDTENFKYVMDIISNNKKRSAELFKNNPHQQVKGYVKEVYSDAKRIEGDKVVYDAERRREAGAIPSTQERKNVGSWQEEFPKGTYSNIVEKSKFAEEHRLKITEDGAFRRVADAELKDKAGRSRDFNEILSATYHSVEAKEVEQKIAKNIIDEMQNGNEMFSRVEKDGYRKVTESEVQSMPKVVADSLAGRYIKEDYDKRLLGREEVTFYRGESQVGKITDKLIRNLTMNMKQNVVLKNPKSYVNTTLFNQLIATSAGVNPAKLVRYQSEALSELSRTDKLREQIALREARGQDAKQLQKQLEKSLLYKMEEAGLAINKLEVSGNDKTLLGTILSDIFGKNKFINRAGNEVNLSQSSAIGKEAYKVFGKIDAVGRYTIAKNFMDQGDSIEIAVQKANGLYADMGQMSPAFVELMDKYPLIPFLKWATLMTPSLMRLVKNNPVKALGLAFVVYGLQVESNTDMNSASPVEGTVNFWDSASSAEFIEEARKEGLKEATWRKVKTFSTPKVYLEIQKELEDSEHNFILKERMKKPHGGQRDLRPLSQRIMGD